MNLNDTYNKIAEDYFKEHKANIEWLNSIYGYLDKFIYFLKPGSFVLDVGRGPGFHYCWIRMIGKNTIIN